MRIEQLSEDKVRYARELEDNQSRYRQSLGSMSNEKKKVTHQRSASRRVRDLELELIQMKSSQEIFLASIQKANEEEKKKLIEKIEKQEQQLKSQKQSRRERLSSISEIQSKHLSEIEELNNNLSRFKQETESELTATKRDKDEALTKAENLEKKVSELKVKLKKTKDQQSMDQVNRGGSRHTSVANLREKSGDRSGFLNLSACNAVDLCATPGDKLNE